MSRHLPRLTQAITDAVAANALDRYSLKYINPYNPSLSAAWMMQRAMSIPADLNNYDTQFINRLLGGNFAAMEKMGDATLKPFLQDVLQAGPLARTLGAQILDDPLFVFNIFGRVGVKPLVDWMVHYVAMVAYTGVYKAVEKLELAEKAEKLGPRQKYLVRRALQRWQFGAGLDYEL